MPSLISDASHSKVQQSTAQICTEFSVLLFSMQFLSWSDCRPLSKGSSWSRIIGYFKKTLAQQPIQEYPGWTLQRLLSAEHWKRLLGNAQQVIPREPPHLPLLPLNTSSDGGHWRRKWLGSHLELPCGGQSPAIIPAPPSPRTSIQGAQGSAPGEGNQWISLPPCKACRNSTQDPSHCLEAAVGNGGLRLHPRCRTKLNKKVFSVICSLSPPSDREANVSVLGSFWNRAALFLFKREP